MEYEHDEEATCEHCGHKFPVAAGACPDCHLQTPTPEQLRGQKVETGTMGLLRITDEDEE